MIRACRLVRGARGGGGRSGTIARGCVVMVVRFRRSLAASAIACKVVERGSPGTTASGGVARLALLKRTNRTRAIVCVAVGRGFWAIFTFVTKEWRVVLGGLWIVGSCVMTFVVLLNGLFTSSSAFHFPFFRNFH